MWHRGGPKGAWQPHLNRISLQDGRSDDATLCTLAHEVGHVVHGHPAATTERQEMKAHIWAARRVVDPRRVLKAAQIYPHSSAMIAHEAGITQHLLRVWCSIVRAEMSHHPDNLLSADHVHA